MTDHVDEKCRNRIAVLGVSIVLGGFAGLYWLWTYGLISHGYPEHYPFPISPLWLLVCLFAILLGGWFIKPALEGD